MHQLALFQLRERGLLELLDAEVKNLTPTGLSASEALMSVSFDIVETLQGSEENDQGHCLRHSLHKPFHFRPSIIRLELPSYECFGLLQLAISEL